MKRLRILFTGGGTGGHVYPLIAVANELKKQSEQFNLELDMRYFGGAREYAEEVVSSGMDFIPIISSKLRRYWSPLNLIDMPKFLLSLIQIAWKMFWFMPDVIFSKGGPGALAVVLVGKFYLIPIIIHESDSKPGLTNKISGNLAKKIFLAFAAAGEEFKEQDKIEVVGNPVRNSLLVGESDQTQAKKNFGFNASEPLVLFLGGSQGAEIINNFILENLEEFIREFQVLHQVGPKNHSLYKKEFEFMTKDWSDIEKSRYRFQGNFSADMGDALLAADVVVARAGSGTIFELAAFGKPSILIPLSGSANEHQKENAYLYSQTSAAIVIQEENLLGNLMLEEIKQLLSSPQKLMEMGAAARSFYKPDSALIIAKYLLTYV
jgi:UDP-N-acetylglucosamine--N-acetylmuramyl-(pentapeptide) pyrophosphoryl-undecaprenol N-acetylglucosamine transferase